MEDVAIAEVFDRIESTTEFKFIFKSNDVDLNRRVSLDIKNKDIREVLQLLFPRNSVSFDVRDRKILLKKNKVTPVAGSAAIPSAKEEKVTITGTVSDADGGEPLPGATIVEAGTTNGVVTDMNGDFSISVKNDQATLVVSYIGFETQEISLNGQTVIKVALKVSSEVLDEIVLVGYGKQKKSDLTGALSSVSAKELEDRPNISITQSLQGAVPGLNIGQVNSAGEEPSISIRGRTSISGSQDPLIVLDGVIYRGSLIDINPNDIKSIDVLKDASSTAVYGSQAANGVIIISTKTGEGSHDMVINYSTYYSIMEPTKKFLPESPEGYVERVNGAYFQSSRTEESGYLEPNPDFDFTSIFRTNDQLRAYQEGITTDWYSITTNNTQHILNHNLSIAKRNDDGGYYMSAGYTDQDGYMVNEDYNRFNARLNIDNDITDWLTFGVQSFLTSSDYSGFELTPESRYDYSWYAPPYEEDGITLLENPRGVGNVYNPYLVINQTDDLDKRLNLFGNVYADVTVPFVPGLSFKVNYNVNSLRNSAYYFSPYTHTFQGEGSKFESIEKEWTNDYIFTYDRTFNEKHKITATVAYGREKRTRNTTEANAQGFISGRLGYNSLQSGSAEQQSVNSSAFQETSLYNLNRLFYGYMSKYLVTLTVRTDGFSGFGEDYKFGTFPSASVAWALGNENFIKDNLNFINRLKLRASYGANGNRTIGRYATLSRVSAGYNYVNGNKESVYTQENSTLANPDLKWESTIGLNIGLDFSILKSRITGSIDYYNTNTEDLLYDVDLPGISRFENIADNLGKLHNNGLEITLSTLNMERENFEWTTDFSFARNRNRLDELLGFDNDGDGVEDDLVSEGLFIGESLGSIYDYQTNGELWQINDDIPSTADVGSFKITDTNGDGVITPDDRVILGNNLPSFRWSMNNSFHYKNWKLSVYVNAVQGGNNHYISANNLYSGSGSFNALSNLSWDNQNFPAGLDFWLPENPDATYQRLGVNVSDGLSASRYMDRSFVRLQDVNLSYTFDKDALKNFDLRVFVNGKNLYTWTDWPGWDPETGEGITKNGRPVLRHYTLGIDITF